MRNERFDNSISEIRDRVVGKTAMKTAKARAVASGLTAALLLSGCFAQAGGALESTPDAPTFTVLPTDIPSPTDTATPTSTSTSTDTLTPTFTQTETPSQDMTDSAVANRRRTEVKNMINTATQSSIDSPTQTALMVRATQVELIQEATEAAAASTLISTATQTPNIEETTIADQIATMQKLASDLTEAQNEFNTKIARSNTPTPTNTYTPTMTPTDTNTATLDLTQKFVDDVSNAAGTIIAQTEVAETEGANWAGSATALRIKQTEISDLLTASAIPTATQTASETYTPSPTLTPTDNPRVDFPEEASLNNFAKDKNVNPFPALLDLEANRTDSGSDTFSTSLKNDQGSFSTDPKQEGGLEMDKNAIEATIGGDALNILINKTKITVDQLIHVNPITKVETWGFHGIARARGAEAYLDAIADDFSQHPERFVKTDGTYMTIDEVMSSPLEKEIEGIQRAIIVRTIDQYIGWSKEGLDSANNNPQDPNFYLPTGAKLPDQVKTCDVYDVRLQNGTAEQFIRPVDHVVEGKETFVEADVNKEYLYYAGSFDENNGVVNYAFTGRGYTDNGGDIDSAAGEQEKPCNTGKPTIIATPSATFTIPNSFVPFETPKPADTPRPGDTPVPTVVFIPTPTQNIEQPTPMPTNVDLFTQVPTDVATTDPNEIPPTSYLP